ncbi:hypothetical protein ACFVUW_11605 [Streptomyces xiamenensis]|uniref:hypothetical protein n=1 Tax=Streptomyces xiamenensis TaxID=408015 RepID=UPI0036E7E5DB
MPQTTTRSTRRPMLTVLLTLLVLTAGCDKLATQSPPEQSDRMTKASGIAKFHIVCPERLWERTNHSTRTESHAENLSEVEPTPLKGEVEIPVATIDDTIGVPATDEDDNA